MTNKRGKIFIVSAPSGAGKSTIVEKAIEKLRNNGIKIERLVTYTTRSPRQGEKNGVDYFFVSKSQFSKLSKDGKFFETNQYNNQFYGSPVDTIEKAKKGISQILVVDYNGGVAYSQKLKDAVTIWIEPPSIELLKSRLKKRGTETNEEINKRIEIALKEINKERRSKLYKYKIVNRELTKAVDEFCSVITDELFG
jgi:guanylate kinase